MVGRWLLVYLLLINLLILLWYSVQYKGQQKKMVESVPSATIQRLVMLSELPKQQLESLKK